MDIAFLRFSLIASAIGSIFILPGCASLPKPARQTALKLIDPKTNTKAFSKHASTLLQVVEDGIKNNTIKLNLNEDALNNVFDFVDAHGAVLRQHLVKIVVAQINTLNKTANLRTVDSSSINTYLNQLQQEITSNRKQWMPLFAKVLVQLQQEVKAGNLHLNVAKNDMTNVTNALSNIIILALEQHPMIAAHPQVTQKIKAVLSQNMPSALRSLVMLMNHKKKSNA